MNTRDNLGDFFNWRCAHQPHALAYAFVRDTLEAAESLTFAALQRQVHALAAELVRHSEPGDRVLLVYPPGLDFVRAFWACMVTGRIAVPVPAPDPMRFKNNAPRLRAIILDAQATLVLTHHELLEPAKSFRDDDGPAGARWLATDGLHQTPTPAPAAATAALRPDSVAYLQYTSGSTSTPRGVILTHANVLAQCRTGGEAIGVNGQRSRLLCWLPHFHDYGLVFGILEPFHAGATSHLMSPLTFLRRPLRWLEAIARYRITHTGAPNFAYVACIKALALQPDWKADLSSLVSSSCGAEPIHPDTPALFHASFAPHGLQPSSFVAAYGMAEAVLGVSAGAPGSIAGVVNVDGAELEVHKVRECSANSTKVRRVVGCGKPFAETELCIVDPKSHQPCAPDQVGEIWVRGSSVGQGYWRRERASADTFGARTAGGEGPYLRTGDLGFLRGGELYVSGRLKDLIIVHGRNHAPQDIEWTVQRSDPALLRSGYGAAFAVETDDGEALVVAQEVERGAAGADLAQLVRGIRRAIADEHDLPVHAVVLIRAGTVPRTTSGKIRRQSCKQEYLAGTLQVLEVADVLAAGNAGAQAAEGEIEATLARVWAEVLSLPSVGRNDNFFELGGHSLMATQLASRIRDAFGVELPLRSLFEAPALAAQALAVAQALRPASGAASAALTSIPRLARDRLLPTSFSQRRMWLIQQFNPQTAAYNMPFALRIRGVLNASAFAASVERLVARHEAFRTTLVALDGEPMQRIAASLPAPFESIDLRSLPEQERTAAATAAVQQRAVVPFNLAQGPLHRLTLLRLGDDDHIFLWLIHHAIGDGWSAMILFHELTTTYSAQLQRQEPTLQTHLVEFADYAAWQRASFAGAALEAQLAYWRQTLHGLEPLPLPADKPRRAAHDGHGSRISETMAPATLANIKTLAMKHGVTPYMALLAAFQLLLSRYSGATDVAVGTPIANRTHTASEHLVGTLVNTVVMRTDLAGDPSFATLLQRVRETALQAYAHQDLPFEALVESLALPRSEGSAPLVQVLFNVLNAPAGAIHIDNIDIEVFDFDSGTSQFDLALSLETEKFGLAQLSFSTDLFEPSTARRLLANYLALLDQVVQSPKAPLSRFDMVGAEGHRLLQDWNGTSSAAPATAPYAATVHALVGQQSLRSPHSTALRSTSGSLKYVELQQRSNQLARLLRLRGVARGALVGLCVGRSLDMVVAQLAILKAGAAYVPLDPAYPSDRIAHMCKDAQLALLITESEVSTPHWPHHKCLLLDMDQASIAAQSVAELEPNVWFDAGPKDPAYVIYTSGSTGLPKGVVVPHGAVVNFLLSMAREPGLKPSDVLAAVTTLSFDIAVLELLLPLTVGAQVLLASRDEAGDGRALRKLLESGNVTVMQATPSTWRLLIEAGWNGSRSFKALIGGESLPVDLAEQLLSRCGSLWNMYGPTETTVWSTCWKVTKPAQGISIGRGIANTRIHVLDTQQQLCAVGAPGEIYIGGDGVALGYLNRAELTAERFIADPFSKAPGARLYRTGDRGRWRHDGLLEHMGRLDHQVKVRGHRIELGEIEASLGKHPAIAQAIVVVREDRPGDLRLVAYLVARTTLPGATTLRDHLRATLPDYMLPQHYVSLSSMPLLPNGKLNRQALPAPAEPVAGGPPGDPPQTDVEIAIAQVWQELLGVTQVSLRDNFFDLGGHSLLAMRAVAAIEERAGVTLSARQLVFESLAQLSALTSASPAISSTGTKAKTRQRNKAASPDQ